MGGRRRENLYGIRPEGKGGGGGDGGKEEDDDNDHDFEEENMMLVGMMDWKRGQRGKKKRGNC